MKNVLILLLLVALVWGLFQGRDDRDAVHPTGRPAAAETAPPSPVERMRSFFRTMTAGMSDLPLPGEEQQPAVTPPTNADTAKGSPPPRAVPTEKVPMREPASDSAAAEAPIIDRTESRRAAEIADALLADSSADFNLADLVDFQEALERRLDRSRFVPAAEIPQMMKNAIIAAEDRRFYDHGAIDVLSVGRAMLANYRAGETVEGGSTISQQTVKNIFLTHERSLNRKVLELFLAIQLEKYYTKDQILEIYLNTIYFGHGAYGIGPASRTYFGKEPRDLSIQECALIAGLPQAPSAYDPIDHPEEAKKRTAIVLMLMAREGYITPQEAAAAGVETVFGDWAP